MKTLRTTIFALALLSLLAPSVMPVFATTTLQSTFEVSATITTATPADDDDGNEGGGGTSGDYKFPYGIQLPENVRDLEGIFDPSNVTNVLTWKNPDSPYADIRVVRSISFFPADPSDGEIVYVGTGEKFVDEDVTIGTVYYYTVFVRNDAGLFSSGSIVRVVAKEGEIATPLPDTIPDAPIETVHPDIIDLTINDFIFIQHGQIIVAHNGQIDIDGNAPFQVLLPYGRVPEVLKTIAITLFHPNDNNKTFSFLLRVNAEKTAYIANIDALQEEGKYNATIMVLDYKNQALKRLAASLYASAAAASDVPVAVGGTISPTMIMLFSLLFILVLLLAYAIYKILDARKRAFIVAKEKDDAAFCPAETIEERIKARRARITTI